MAVEDCPSKFTLIPLGDVCRKCGVACASWPHLSQIEVIEMARKDRKVKAELLIMGEVQCGTKDRGRDREHFFRRVFTEWLCM
jgi:hypothetical protein